MVFVVYLLQLLIIFTLVKQLVGKNYEENRVCYIVGITLNYFNFLFEQNFLIYFSQQKNFDYIERNWWWYLHSYFSICKEVSQCYYNVFFLNFRCLHFRVQTKFIEKPCIIPLVTLYNCHCRDFMGSVASLN